MRGGRSLDPGTGRRRQCPSANHHACGNLLALPGRGGPVPADGAGPADPPDGATGPPRRRADPHAPGLARPAAGAPTWPPRGRRGRHRCGGSRRGRSRRRAAGVAQPPPDAGGLSEVSLRPPKEGADPERPGCQRLRSSTILPRNPRDSIRSKASLTSSRGRARSTTTSRRPSRAASRASRMWRPMTSSPSSRPA